MVRALAGWDVDQYARVLQWPVREACLAFEQQLRERAEREYRDALLRHVLVAQWSKDAKPPKLPPILKDA